MRRRIEISFDFEGKEVFDFCIKNGITEYEDAIEIMTFNKIKSLVDKKHKYSIKQDKDGRWRTYVKDDSKAYGRKAIKKTNERELYSFLYDFYGIEEGETRKSLCTLEDLYPEWLEYKKLHTTASTYITRIESDWRTYYKDTNIIKVPLIKLDKLTLDKWAHALIKDHDMTKNNYYNVTVIMRQSLEYAVDSGLLKNNPFKEVKIDGRRMFRKVQKKPDAEQVFTAEECRQLCEYAWKDYHDKVKYYELAPLCMMFQMQTGLRVGEAVAVKYTDLEIPNYIHVQRMLRRDEKIVVDHTKSDCGDCQVPLTPMAKDLIETARRHQEAAGCTSPYIFSMTDEPISEYSVQELYRKYCRWMGIWTEDHPKYKVSHASRRTYISALLDQGVNLNTVRQAAGHADEKTTLKNYTFDRGTEEEKMNKFALALSF